MTTIKIYRNLPIVDQIKTASLLRRLLPFYFKMSQGFYHIYITMELPFIGMSFKVGKLFK
jgi:hypothetical protein